MAVGDAVRCAVTKNHAVAGLKADKADTATAAATATATATATAAATATEAPSATAAATTATPPTQTTTSASTTAGIKTTSLWLEYDVPGLPMSPDTNTDDPLSSPVVLGTGCSGSVVRGVQRRTGCPVAVKFLPFGKSAVRELRALRAVQGHPNVVKLLDAFVASAEDLTGKASDDGDNNSTNKNTKTTTKTKTSNKTTTYLVLMMELLAGGELFDLVKEHGALSEHLTGTVAAQLASALAFMHERGVTHRDVKLENVMLRHRPRSESEDDDECCPMDTSMCFVGDEDAMDTSTTADSPCSSPTAPSASPSPFEVVLCDFGFATLAEAPHELYFTPSYIAPEVLSAYRAKKLFGRRQSYTNAVDMWALGVLLYICNAGYPPFYTSLPASSPGGRALLPLDMQDQIRCGVYRPPAGRSRKALALVRQLLAISPAARPTAADLATHLAAA